MLKLCSAAGLYRDERLEASEGRQHLEYAGVMLRHSSIAVPGGQLTAIKRVPFAQALQRAPILALHFNSHSTLPLLPAWALGHIVETKESPDARPPSS